MFFQAQKSQAQTSAGLTRGTNYLEKNNERRKQPQQIKKQKSLPHLTPLPLGDDSSGNDLRKQEAIQELEAEQIQITKKPLFPCHSSAVLLPKCLLGPKSLKKPMGPKELANMSIIDVESISSESEDPESSMLPLHAACLRGDADEVERLIRKGGCAVDQRCRGLTPLHYACQAE